jgi:hypothetical protein
MANPTELCAFCARVGTFARHLCVTDYKSFTEHCVANGSMSREERDREFAAMTAPPATPKWEYEPTPEQTAALIAMTEQ